MKKQPSPTHKKSPTITCIDLFCGVGGLTHGLIKQGIKVIAGVDFDPQCHFPYEYNNQCSFIEQDVRKVSKVEINQMFGNATVKLLAGCAPCQPFSTYNQKGSCLHPNSKWELISDFGRLVQEVKPELVTMENVPQLSKHPVFKVFLESLQDYAIWWNIVDCSLYGVPQTRKRLVLLASRLGLVELLPPHTVQKKYSTVREAIYHLPPLKAGCSDANDPLHTASTLSPLNLRRIQASKPGGTWRDWDESLLAACHRKRSGQYYQSVYGRMEWDAPAPTITTQCFGYGNGRFGHPEQDRAISLREAAILQTFPESYCFLAPQEPVRFNRIGRLIGNAVPVRIGEVVAQSFIEHLHRNL